METLQTQRQEVELGPGVRLNRGELRASPPPPARPRDYYNKLPHLREGLHQYRFILSVLEVGSLRQELPSLCRVWGCCELDLECSGLAALLREMGTSGGGACLEKVDPWAVSLKVSSSSQFHPLCLLSGHQMRGTVSTTLSCCCDVLLQYGGSKRRGATSQPCVEPSETTSQSSFFLFYAVLSGILITANKKESI